MTYADFLSLVRKMRQAQTKFRNCHSGVRKLKAARDEAEREVDAAVNAALAAEKELSPKPASQP